MCHHVGGSSTGCVFRSLIFCTIPGLSSNALVNKPVMMIMIMITRRDVSANVGLDTNQGALASSNCCEIKVPQTIVEARQANYERKVGPLLCLCSRCRRCLLEHLARVEGGAHDNSSVAITLVGSTPSSAVSQCTWGQSSQSPRLFHGVHLFCLTTRAARSLPQLS